MASVGSRTNVDGMLVKSTMTSRAAFVSGDGERLIRISRPRRFYIDDILASDFGHRCLEKCRPISSELDEHQWTIADTASAHRRDPPSISAISLDNDRASELDKATGAALAMLNKASMTTSRSPSSSVTSSRRFYDNGMLTDTTTSSMRSKRRTALKDDVKVEPCGSTNTEVTANNDTSPTVCDVTSSTTSHPVVVSVSERNPDWKADDKDCITIPAWVYCTRYSDRPSAGNVHCEPKKHTKMFLSYLPQNPIDSDNIWHTLSSS